MPRRVNHLDANPIPAGYTVYEPRLEVRGIQHYRRAAKRFINGVQRRLELEPDPRNRFDPLAIKVIGVWKHAVFTQRAHIGHVTREIAEALASCALTYEVRARLAETYINEAEFVVVVYQLLGPEGREQAYHDQIGDAPVGDTWNEKMERYEERELRDAGPSRSGARRPR